MPFVKGDPRINRNGRPKKNKTLTDLVQKILEKKDVQKGYNTISRKEAILEILVQEALKGDLKAIGMIWERIEGKPDVFQQIDLDGDLRIPNLIVKSFQTQDEDASDT